MRFLIIISWMITVVSYPQSVFTQEENIYQNEITKVSMQVYPQTVCIGDTLYCLVSIFNKTTQIIGFRDLYTRHRSASPLLHFEFAREQKQYIGAIERISSPNPYSSRHVGFIEISAGKQEVYTPLLVQLPFLEDLHDPFWQEEIVMLVQHPEGLTYRMEVSLPYFPWLPHLTYDEYSDRYERRVRLCSEITIKLRPEKEMVMIEQWYDNACDKNVFPTRHTYKDNFTQELIPYKRATHEGALLDFRKCGAWKYDNNPSIFLHDSFSRYPGYPNAPETWQGWKELEESLTPSTMRDEIHLTRILIQYCDTEDDIVLKELKDWFDGMNEIQRTVMAKSLRDRAYDTAGTDFLPPFREVYKTIRQYDVVPVPQSKVKHLRNLGLIK